MSAAVANRLKRTVDESPELSLLLACSTLEISPAQQQCIQDLATPALNWTFLIKAALMHRMLPMLHRGLYQSCPHEIPEPVKTSLHRYCQANSLKNLFFEHQLQTLLAWFKAAQIPVIAYKGPTLANIAYGDLSLRQFTDLDLLVRSQDFECAQHLLRKQGFTASLDLGWEIHYVSGDQQVCVDVHRSLVPDFFGLPENFINPSRDLSPEDWLLLLAIQLGKDCCHWKVRLGQLCDIAALLQSYPNLDFAAVLNQAQQLGCVRFLGIALILVQEFLPIKLPLQMQPYLSQRSIEHRLAHGIFQRIQAETETPHRVPDDAGFWYFLRVYNHWFYLQVRERPEDKLRYCAYWIWKVMRMSVRPNQADRALVSLPSALHFLYVPIHMGRLMWKYSRKQN